MLNRYLTRTIRRATFPEMESVSFLLYSGNDEERFWEPYTLHDAKRRPYQASESNSTGHKRVGLKSCKWQIFEDALRVAGIPRNPQAGDRIEDSAGIVWHIESVSGRMFENMFDCDCSEVPEAV